MSANKEEVKDPELDVINENAKEINEAVDNLEIEKEAEKPEDEATKAKSHGHKSYEQFVAEGGNPKDYKTEREFNLTGELIELKKSLQKRDKDIEELVKYQQQVIEQHRLKMRQEIDAKLAEARQVGDIAQVERLTQEKTSHELMSKQEEQQRQMEMIRQVDTDFYSRNQNWYNDTHPELKGRVVEIDNIIRMQYPTITYAQRVGEIERQMRFELSRDDRYSHLVVDPNTVTRPVVSSTKSAVAKSATTTNDSDDAAYSKLTANQKARYGVLNRLEMKLSKGTKKLSVKKFLADEQRDEEI